MRDRSPCRAALCPPPIAVRVCRVKYDVCTQTELELQQSSRRARVRVVVGALEWSENLSASARRCKIKISDIDILRHQKYTLAPRILGLLGCRCSGCLCAEQESPGSAVPARPSSSPVIAFGFYSILEYYVHSTLHIRSVGIVSCLVMRRASPQLSSGRALHSLTTAVLVLWCVCRPPCVGRRASSARPTTL